MSEAVTTPAAPTTEQNATQPTPPPAETKAVENVDAAPKAEVQPPAKEVDKLAPKFAALTKREREIQKREADLKAQEAEIKSFKAERENARKLAKENPLEFMKQYDLTYDQVTSFILNDGKKTAEQEIAEIKQQLSDKDKAEQDKSEKAQKAIEEQAINGFKENVKSHISKNAEKYEYISQLGQHDTVFAVIEEHFNTTGNLLSIEDASNLVENHFEKEAEKLLSFKKVQAKIKPTEKPAEEKTTPGSEQTLDAKKVNSGPKTLTNSQQAALPSRQERKLSNEESLAEAAKLLKFV